MITFQPKPGAILPDVAAECALLARLNRDTVQVDFDGVHLEVPGTASQVTVERAYFDAKKKTKARQPYAD